MYAQVNEQIRVSGGDASSVVLVLTDGQLSDLAAARTEVYIQLANLLIW